MTEKIHAEEADTSESVVRSLLATQCPAWAALPLSWVHSSGTSNAMWRISRADDVDLVVRLPRTPGAADSVARELALLPELSGTPGLVVPVVAHAGHSTDEFPHPWAVLEWFEGSDAWAGRDELDRDALLADLTAVIETIGSVREAPVEVREDGGRGGPLGSLLTSLDLWLSDPQWRVADHMDVSAVRRLADEARELVDEPVTTSFVHGDLIPGNLLVRHGRLHAVVDWGCAAWADPAQDLAPAWAVFDGLDRQRFRNALEVDDATWLRARTFELEHAVGGVVYYVPRGHALGDVMSRTLHRILTGD